MRTHLLFAPLTSAALVLLALSGGDAQAGSFLGPCCYGARYTNRYPNRSHNVFGCGPGCPCRAWHPYFHPGLSRRKRCEPNEGMPVGAMPVNCLPEEQVQAPLEQSPFLITPVQSTWLAPPPRPPVPVVQQPAPTAEPRLIPFPRPVPSGPTRAKPSQLDSLGK